MIDNISPAMYGALMSFKLGKHDPEDTENMILVSFTEKEQALVLVGLTLLAQEMRGAPEFTVVAKEVFGGLLQKLQEINSARLEDEWRL